MAYSLVPVLPSRGISNNPRWRNHKGVNVSPSSTSTALKIDLRDYVPLVVSSLVIVDVVSGEIVGDLWRL